MESRNDVAKKLDSLSLASLILGLCTFASVWCCIGYPIGVVAIVLGAVALSRHKKGYSDISKVLSISGIAVSLASIALHVVLMMIGMVSQPTVPNSGQRTSTTTDRTSQANVREPTMAAPAVVNERPINETCYQLATKFGASSSLSDLQKSERWKDYEGSVFEWSLKVTEVSSDLFGGYTVQYKCAPKSSSFIQDVQIKYPESRKQYVMQLSKNQTYTVKGRLGMSSAILGMTADDVP